MRFEKRKRASSRPTQPAPVGRIPRVSRLLALAHRIDSMIRAGEIRDWAEAAQFLGITRARMTQIANLLLLAPRIQETLLDLHPVTEGRDLITERQLRRAVSPVNWLAQNMGRQPSMAPERRPT